MAEAGRSARFNGQVAFITGGTQGIGETYARQLASEGASIALVDVNEARPLGSPCRSKT